MQDIYQALSHDHDEVRSLLKKISNKEGDTQSNFKMLIIEVIKHSFAEERIFYRKLRDIAGSLAPTGVNEGYIEHHIVNNLISLMHAENKDTTEWEQLFSLLYSHLESHLNIEEQHMFPCAKEILSKADAAALAQAFANDKKLIENKIGSILQSSDIQELHHEIVNLIMESNEDLIGKH